MDCSNSTTMNKHGNNYTKIEFNAGLLVANSVTTQSASKPCHNDNHKHNESDNHEQLLQDHTIRRIPVGVSKQKFYEDKINNLTEAIKIPQCSCKSACTAAVSGKDMIRFYREMQKSSEAVCCLFFSLTPQFGCYDY